MKSIWRRRRTLAIAAVAMAAAGAASYVGRPRVVHEPLLGTEWHRSRTAFLVTTCSHSSEKITTVPSLSVRLTRERPQRWELNVPADEPSSPRK